MKVGPFQTMLIVMASANSLIQNLGLRYHHSLPHHPYHQSVMILLPPAYEFNQIQMLGGREDYTPEPQHVLESPNGRQARAVKTNMKRARVRKTMS